MYLVYQPINQEMPQTKLCSTIWKCMLENCLAWVVPSLGLLILDKHGAKHMVSFVKGFFTRLSCTLLHILYEFLFHTYSVLLFCYSSQVFFFFFFFFFEIIHCILDWLFISFTCTYISYQWIVHFSSVLETETQMYSRVRFSVSSSSFLVFKEVLLEAALFVPALAAAENRNHQEIRLVQIIIIKKI